jgi:hypothetical protein
MPTATQAKTFNYDLFRKRVRLADSDFEGERNLALTQALRQCAEQQPPMLFFEAVCAAFGQVDKEERERLLERAEEAEAKVEDQRKKAGILAAAIEQQKEIGARLKQENARLAEELESRPPVDPDSPWVQDWMLQPTALLLILGIAVACEWAAVTPFAKSCVGDSAGTVSEWIHVLCMVLFAAWSFAIHKRKGWDRMMSSWGIWIGGWVFIAVTIGFTDPTFDTGTFAFRQLLVPYCWWATMGANFSPNDLVIVFVALAFVVDGNAGLPVCRWIVPRLKWAFAGLRERLATLIN